ncbi:MAG: Ig-like domain-containing protein, partial [Candidatus Onthovivens sp.]|nr:Ig-like domain-containing protein [Candidatus Onthovivens sp.]
DYKDGLIVYGSTATTTAITWDGVNEQYTFNNPKDYLTNDLTKNLVVGQEIDVELIRADFTKDDVVTKEVCAVIKSAKPVVPTEIKISGESKVALNENITLTATTNPAQISVPLTWESSNAEVAKVSEEGVVTGLSVGKALITAKYGTVVSNSIEVEVTNIIAPTSITIEGASKIKVSETTTYTISAIEPSDYNVKLTWSSSNTEVATIDNSGVVTGVSAGTTEITVSYGEVVSNAITLTVEAKNSSTLNATNLGLTGSYTNSGANVTIEGLTVAWTQLYKGTNGIQFRVKNGVNSAIYNAEASTKSIKNIVINWNAEKNTSNNTEFMHMYFGNDTSVGSETINVDKSSGVNTVTITPSASTYTFFKLEHRSSKKTAYIDSIEIVYVD